MMHNPPHPGEVLKEALIEALGLTITEAAEHLYITRVALSRVLNGHAGISSNLAIRLEKAGLSTARAWIAMQAYYDLYQAQKRHQPEISPFKKRVIA